MALDIDHYPVAREFLAGHGIDLDALMADETRWQIVSPRVNSMKLLFSLPEPRPSKSCAPYETDEIDERTGKPKKKNALEFRCGTKGGKSVQDVLPPSLHPSGKPYEWDFGDEMVPDPPPCPQALLDLWTKVAGEQHSREMVAPKITVVADAQIEKWLATEDPSQPYDGWLRVGAKLHEQYGGSDAGLAIFDRWSQKSTKYSTPDERGMSGYALCHLKWRSFRAGRPGNASPAADIRTLPADSEEFPVVAPTPEAAPQVVPATQDAVPQAAEGKWEQDIKKLFGSHLYVLTGESNTPYYILPGHPDPEIAEMAGLTGLEMGASQFNRNFQRYVEARNVGKKVVVLKPADIVDGARWVKKAHGLGFHPGEGQTFKDPDNGRVWINFYSPYDIQPKPYTSEQIYPLEFLLNRIHGERNGEPVFARWLLALYAFTLRNPGTRVRWAPLLFSMKQGTGKTLLLHRLPELLFGETFVKSMTYDALAGKFQGGVFRNAWWIHLAELRTASGRLDARTVGNKMKTWITDRRFQTERKGVDIYELTNRLQFTAASNYEDALLIEDGSGERRWMVGEISNSEFEAEDRALVSRVFGEQAHPDARGWLKHFFLNLNIDWFDPDADPPATGAKEGMQESGRGQWEDRLSEGMEDRPPPFDRDVVTRKAVQEFLMTSNQRPTGGQVHRLLKQFRFEELERTSQHRHLYAWRNIEQWRKITPREVHEYLHTGVRPRDPSFWPDHDLIGEF